MGKALYRKYRPKKLSEVVGQKHITTALENALRNDRIGHAYLFIGPRGIGKTSIARILAHDVNKLPYDENETHLDIIEIDAASNRRIDEIRTLRERVHSAPTSAKYKVYIIDEVHMLTKEAFNALLKTLEEPPAHVIFILATTEAHKLPETIISRTQRYTFKPAKLPETAKHLKHIAKSEKIDIDDDALELIAIHGQGSFRDSISLLDQLSNTSSQIQIEDVHRSLGIAPNKAIQQIIDKLITGNAAELIDQLTKLYEQGYQAPQIAKQLGKVLRDNLLDGIATIEINDSVTLLQKLIDVPSAHDPITYLEITLLSPIINKISGNQPSTQIEKPKTQRKTKKTPEEPSQPELDKTKSEASKTQEIISKTILDESSWRQVLHALKQQHNTLYGIARMAVPLFDEGKLTLSFRFPFHQKRFIETKNIKIITNLIREHTGSIVAIECVVDKQKLQTLDNIEQATPEAKDLPNTPLDTINDIFGGGEILK